MLWSRPHDHSCERSAHCVPRRSGCSHESGERLPSGQRRGFHTRSAGVGQRAVGTGGGVPLPTAAHRARSLADRRVGAQDGRVAAVRWPASGHRVGAVRGILSSAPPPKKVVTVIPADGIGPELMQAATQVVDATGAPIEWDWVEQQSTPNTLPKSAVKSLKRTGVGLTGFFAVPIGPNTAMSANVRLYRELDLYANVVHSFEVPGPNTRHKDVDIVVIRENTEGEYSGMEHEVAPGITETIKVTSRAKTRRIAEYAFEYAFLNNRRKVTAVHKANVMVKSDGLFLESCREQARLYPTVELEEVIIDNCMMRLVSQPQHFDVIVTPNLYGSLVANGVAGLTAGVGVCGGANLGPHASVFEQGARHVGLDIAGKNVVNPTGIILASSMMLRHIRQPNYANKVDAALYNVLLDANLRTADQGGTTTTTEFVAAVVAELQKMGRTK